MRHTLVAPAIDQSMLRLLARASDKFAPEKSCVDDEDRNLIFHVLCKRHRLLIEHHKIAFHLRHSKSIWIGPESNIHAPEFIYLLGEMTTYLAVNFGYESDRRWEIMHLAGTMAVSIE